MNKLIHLTTQKAHKRLLNNDEILFLDVRSYAENKFVGRPIDITLLPWIDEPDWQVNPKFCQLVGNILADRSSPLDTEIILICRSGYRSTDAGNALIKKGFKNVAHVMAGFEGDLDENNQRGHLNGWRHDGLPWEQS